MSRSAQIPAMTPARKAAVLLALLGDDASTEICKHLGKDDLKLLAQEISDLDEITAEMAAQVLQEYQGLAVAPTAVAQAGPAFAKKLVVKTLGDEGSRPLVENVIRAKEKAAQNLEALEKADPKEIAKVLQEEHPQTIALILAHLNTNLTKAVLLLLPDQTRTNAIKRLAQMQNFSPDIVNKVTARLLGKLKPKKEDDRRAYGGVRAVAELLNRIDGNVAKSILETIEKENDGLAVSIRDQMFTFEDFAGVPDVAMRELLSQVDKKSLAMALKGASEGVQNRFYSSMSSRAVEMLKEDSEALGPARASDVKQAQAEIILVARKLETEGKITLRASEEEGAYVG
ncbi:MAG TPA: flagellar motor switch protein FliG [Verrucomicrobiae bacterium]|nr:flagellar motor switch protein FliG [Verrucomicrobiae bacterium]